MVDSNFNTHVQEVCRMHGGYCIRDPNDNVDEYIVDTIFGEWAVRAKEEPGWYQIFTEFRERKKLDVKLIERHHSEIDRPTKESGQWTKSHSDPVKIIHWFTESIGVIMRLTKLNKQGKL